MTAKGTPGSDSPEGKPPRPAPQSNLDFEPEPETPVSPQLQEGLSRAYPLLRSTLAFEPEKDVAGEPGRGPRSQPPPPSMERPPERESVTRLLDLAAGRKARLVGDLEAELFLSPRGKAPRPPYPSTGERGPAPATDLGEAASGISVFLSEAVSGPSERPSRLRRMSFRASRAAERALFRHLRKLKSVLARADAFTRRFRVPLANAFWSVFLSLFVLLLDAPSWGALLCFSACLALTVAGKSARDLLGYAGIFIAAVALAEIVRQRARFAEIFFGFMD